MIKETSSTSSQSASTSGSKPLGPQQQEVIIRVPSFSDSRLFAYNSPPSLKLPVQDLLRDGREYRRIGVPLYEASVKCDWKAAEAILDKNQDLVRYCITENGDTALHIASSIKRSKHVEKFVRNLVNRMYKQDLELQNKNYNTALYLAASSGNIKTVRIMVQNNRTLTTIAGANGTMMPLYAAALYGNYEVVKYLYEYSNDLCDDAGWDLENRGRLFEKCAEGDMLDIAVKIQKKYPGLRSDVVLGVLARKPNAFSETETSITKIKRSINIGDV